MRVPISLHTVFTVLIMEKGSIYFVIFYTKGMSER